LGLPSHPTDNKWWEYFLATNLANTPGRILKLYKNRCGVKSPYRKVGEFLPKTTQRSHAVRVFYFTLAALSTTCGSSSKHTKQRIKVIRLKQVFLETLSPHLTLYSKKPSSGVTKASKFASTV
jgi:hypothetical protein